MRRGTIRARTALATGAALVVLTVAATAEAAAAPMSAVLSGPARTARQAFVWRTVGRSVQGRPILMASFGRGTRRVLFVGGVHGDEWGQNVAAQFASYLTRHRPVVPAGTRVDVVYCLNPDGAARRTRGNARGVDLNRNFPSRDWVAGTDGGLSHGAYAASEPETRVMLGVLRTGYARVVSLHSRGPLLDFDGAGGWTVAQAMARACGYPVGHVGTAAGTRGSMGHYVPETYHVPVVTVELGEPSMTAAMRQALLAATR